MNLQAYQNQHGITDAWMCHILNDWRPSVADPPVLEHRLIRLKDGKQPTKLERYLVHAATDGECDRYN